MITLSGWSSGEAFISLQKNSEVSTTVTEPIHVDWWDDTNFLGTMSIGDHDCGFKGYLQYFSISTGNSFRFTGEQCGAVECEWILGDENNKFCLNNSKLSWDDETNKYEIPSQPDTENEFSTVDTAVKATAIVVVVTAVPMIIAGADPSLIWGLASLMQML